MSGEIQIEHWKLSRLKPYDKNSRTHPPEQVAQIKASIREFGFVTPILVDGKGTIIAGHCRAQCASELGLKTVPVVKLSHLSDAQAIALRIADNSLPMSAGWDVDLLQAELGQLEEMKFDLAPLGLDSIMLPDLEEPAPPASRTNKTKSTIFVSVKNADAAKAKKVISDALRKAKIEANI